MLGVAWSKCPNANVLNLTRGVCCQRHDADSGSGLGEGGRGGGEGRGEGGKARGDGAELVRTLPPADFDQCMREISLSTNRDDQWMKAASNFIDFPLFAREVNCTELECWKVRGNEGSAMRVSAMGYAMGCTATFCALRRLSESLSLSHVYRRF